MKKSLLLLPFIALSTTSCNKINELNSEVQASTYSIQANEYAVRRSTQVIRENAQLIDASTQAIRENHQLLEAASQ